MRKVELLRWRSEHGSYLVAHPFLNIISQGETLAQATDSFLHSVAMIALHIVDNDGKASFKLAPPEVSAAWAKMASVPNESEGT